ncbi:response regulator transcription factor [Haliangium ochraceum]|uniref:Phosphate regulon transcriptional regulatory protein PhoB n=1 Tax=Haliangium ochraceum (strain DSM 14365 / JCM 11303 / SMP-2) TaxID=502025 RepID=D0LLH3_HALO1|nr:response regulator transcription factor [Haliangium ochraceum]ACY13190.1 two component transcriptional regulator, winged helix family [Haliangium ochraceum DSM 14365]
MSQHKILIVEDDEAIAAGLALNLKIAGYQTTVVHDGLEALKRLEESSPHLILLDINLPSENGIGVLGTLRQSGNQVPVIILSARDDEYDKVAALRLGADDYITKPFGLAELMARVAAVLRRVGTQEISALHRFGSVEVELETRSVVRQGEAIKLTHLEFELLAFLVKNPSRVFSREELLRQVWKQSSGTLRTVDNFVAQLRSKLESDPENPRFFITVRGSGYRFDS